MVKISIIAVINSKGGVGKTTVCVHTGHALALAGKRTLIIDLDVQDNIRIWLDAAQKEVTLFEVLTENKPIKDAIINVRDNLDIIPSGGDNLGAVPFLLSKSGKNIDALKLSLGLIHTQYDFVLIDCSPSRSLLHTIAIYASDYVAIPVSMEWLAVVGSGQVTKAIQEVKDKYKLKTEVKLIIPTFLDRRRSRICDDVLESLKSAYSGMITNPIRINSKLSEAPGYGKTIFDMRDKRGVEDFQELAERVIVLGKET